MTYSAPASRIIGALTSPVNAPFALPVKILRRNRDVAAASGLGCRMERGERRRDDESTPRTSLSSGRSSLM